MIIFKNKEITSSKQLSAYLAKTATLDIADFSSISQAVELLFKYTLPSPLSDDDSLFILNHWKQLNNTHPSKVPYFKAYVINASSKFRTTTYLEFKTKYPRANPYATEYIMLRDYCTEEEALIKVNKLKEETSSTLEAFIKRHGEELGRQKFEEFSKKSAHTLKSFTDKHGDIDGAKKYTEYLSKKDSNSLAYFINKFGSTEGKKRYELNCKQIGYYSTIEYYIETYGAENGFIKYKENSMSKGKSSSYFIETYGEAYWRNLYELKLLALGYDETFEKLEGFNAYRKRVHNLSKQQPIWTLPYASKQGHLKLNEEAYNLDHKYSVYQCYKDNIPEHIASNIVNLEFIPMRQNISKGIKCSITKEQLLKEYNNYENKKNNYQ